MITIKFRRDHDYKWERSNPVLRSNELVVVYTALGTKYKLGDGKKHYNDLHYITNICSLGAIKLYVENSSEAAATIDFEPEHDKYKTTRDPFGVYNS